VDTWLLKKNNLSLELAVTDEEFSDVIAAKLRESNKEKHLTKNNCYGNY